MSTVTATEHGGASAQAVDEEYEKLERFLVGRGRVVMVDDNRGSEGGFGIVRRAELHQSAYLPAWLASRQYGPPQLVAVKQIKISAVSNMPRVKRAFTREMLVWSRLEAHPGIAKFLGFYADFKRSEAWLLSPWEPNGNVSEFIKAHNLEVPEKLSLIYDTIDALNFLHQLEPPVCHGDIKSANVLVSADYRARLCDFGLARLHEDSGFGRLETSTGMKGSIRWCSPEILNDAPRTPNSDVYAWAWLVWEIMTGDLPYQGTSADYAIMRKIFESPLPQVDGASRLSDCLQIWELMTRCWNVDPAQRPTALMCKTTVTYLPRCTPTPTNVDHPTRSAELLETLGDLESWKGNLEQSSAYLDEALRLYQGQGNTKGIASVLRKQAAAAFRISEHVKVCDIASTALELCRDLNDALGIADASYYLSSSTNLLGDAEAGLPGLRESLEICRAYGDDVGVVRCLERIGSAQWAKDDLQGALSTLDEAIAIASRSGDRLGLANALHIAGLTHADLFDFTKATNALSEAITITRNVGLDGELSIKLHAMGGLKMRLGDHPEAQDLFQESISIARRVSDRWGIADGLSSLGECLRRQSRFDEAVSALKESCALWQQQSLADKVAGQLISVGKIMVETKRYDEAALHFEAAIVTCRDYGYSWPRECEQMSAIPKTVMKWESHAPLLCDLRKLERRLPQLFTANLKLPISINHQQP